ncbi:hypothetical protein ACUZ9P_08655 [Desulfovibrio sp. QI0430]
MHPVREQMPDAWLLHFLLWLLCLWQGKYVFGFNCAVLAGLFASVKLFSRKRRSKYACYSGHHTANKYPSLAHVLAPLVLAK